MFFRNVQRKAKIFQKVHCPPATLGNKTLSFQRTEHDPYQTMYILSFLPQLTYDASIYSNKKSFPLKTRKPHGTLKSHGTTLEVLWNHC